MEESKSKFEERLDELVEVAKKKKNVLENHEINDFFADMEIDAEQFPYEVTRDILSQVHTTKAERKNRKLAEVAA